MEKMSRKLGDHLKQSSPLPFLVLPGSREIRPMAAAQHPLPVQARNQVGQKDRVFCYIDQVAESRRLMATHCNGSRREGQLLSSVSSVAT